MGIRPLFRVGKEQATQLFRFVTHVDIRCVGLCMHMCICICVCVRG